jgi:uncharacterized oligopeptide transporter (OPT) family protein
VAYLLFGVGAAVAVVMEMLGKSSLVFALGMYLPLGLTSPILAGGFLSHLVNKRSEKYDAETGKSIRERGVILASGLMAGGALGGVLGASLRMFSFYSEDGVRTPFYANEMVSQLVSLVLFLGLCLYVWFFAQKKEQAS